MDTLQAYRRAAAVYRANRQKSVLNETVRENWIKGSGDFWYALDVENEKKEVGTRYMRCRVRDSRSEPLFDHERLAGQLAPTWVEKADSFKLPIQIRDVDDASGRMYFTIAGAAGEFVFDFAAGDVSRLDFVLHDRNVSTSPDGRYSVFVRDHDLFCRDNSDGSEIRLTSDGEENCEYGVWTTTGAVKFLDISWSPDSKRLITPRRDKRLLGKMVLTRSVPASGRRPEFLSYPYELPGDEHICRTTLFLVDLEEKQARPIMQAGKPVEVNLLGFLDGAMGLPKRMNWTKDGKNASFLNCDRFFKTYQCLLIDAKAAVAQTAVEETYQTFGCVDYCFSPNPAPIYLPETEEVVWLSEIEGCGALYLYDARTGLRIRRLTPETMVARAPKYLDEAARELYFTSSGIQPDVDPYYQFLYKVELDTGRLCRISGETAEHNVRFSPDGTCFLDTFSTVQTVPKTVLCRLDGTVMCTVAESDISRILEKGYIMPEPFTALARDGKTPIYGILVKPYGFDPARKYPVVDYAYGGSSAIITPKAFCFSTIPNEDPMGGLQSLAQLGFVGIIVDGLATPRRSKAIHDYVYGRAEECCGLEDHVCAIRQLAERFSWIDPDRVGIWGQSGGGYAAARALLDYPDFYKVGVSVCGNHDQTVYGAFWGERWIGPYSEEAYRSQANQTCADKLTGKLLLIHGEADDNVHVSAAMRLADALIKANKDFDMLIVPNADHSVGLLPYVVRRRWDYFVRFLAGQTPPREFSIDQGDWETEV